MTTDLDSTPLVLGPPGPVSDLVVIPMGDTVFQAVPVVPAALHEEAWDLYLSAFEELRTRAAQRHVMYRHEFDELMADARITKFLGFEGSSLAALAVSTNDLDAVPLISPEFYAARYPEHYAARRIFYVGFFCVRQDRQRSGVLIDLMRVLAIDVEAVNGICAMDISNARRARHMDKAVGRVVRGVAPGARTVCLDEQSFWAYEFTPVD